MNPDRRREIEAFAAGAGRDLRVLTETLAALAAAEARAEQAERERDAADEEAQNARSVAQMAASDRDEAMDNFDNLSLELERLEKQLTADNAALRERLATVEAALLIADELSDDLEDVAQELANRTHGQPRYEPIIRAALQTVTRYNEARAALAATPAAGEVE